MDQPQVFYTHEWALAVSRAYGDVLCPLLFLAYDPGDILCGIAALASEGGAGRACFLGATTGDYCDFITVPEMREAFVVAVLEELERRNVSEITLANLPADSATIDVLKTPVISSRYHHFARTGYVCAQVNMALLARRSDGVPVLPRRKMVRHALSVMGRDNPIRLEHLRTMEEILGNLPEFMKAHVTRFVYTGRVSNIARERRRVFLTELARLLSGPGWVVLTRMMSGDRALSWNYGFCFQGTWFWYQPTFDSDLEKYSPGFCLLTKLIEDVAGNSTLQLVDLGLGAEEYKDRIGNQTREILYITLKKSLLGHCREILRYRTAESIRRSRFLEGYTRKVVQGFTHFRDRLLTKGICSTLSYVMARMRDILWLECEIIFFEWFGTTAPRGKDFELREFGWNDLGEAVMQYSEDSLTLEYLLRAASRLRRGGARPHCIIDRQGKFVHFAWSADFRGFYVAELKRRVSGPGEGESSIIFDCWTPPGIRGQGHYRRAVAVLAEELQRQGQRPWIFSASRNVASVCGLNQSGFRRVSSLVRNRLLGLGWISSNRSNSENSGEPEVHLSPGNPAA